MKTLPLLLILFVYGMFADAQAKVVQEYTCRVPNRAFQAGEKVTYELTYNFGIPWLKVGTATYSVHDAMLDNKKVFFMEATGNSYASWEWFYKMKALYQTWIDPVTIRPIKYHREVWEPTYWLKCDYQFNWSDSLAYMRWSSKKTPLKLDTIKITPCTNELMSVLYYARTLNFSNFKPDNRIPVTMLIDGELFSIYFRYIGKEPVKIKNFGEFNCLKFAVYLVEGTMFHEGENMFLWVTDDENKIPMLVESPIKVGSVKARVIDLQGLRNPMKSKLN